MLFQQWVDHRVDPDRIDQFVREHHLTRPTALLLAARMVPSDEVGSFLYPRLRELGDPYILPGTRKAAERLWKAIQGGERILIHGDYDTDGITSTVLLSWVLRQSGAEVECFLPDRIADGYGLGVPAVERAVACQCSVIVTVDCGITSCDAAIAARKENIDLIVTDHHQPGETLPEAWCLINPKLHADLPDLHHLAGVGVCFKLCHALLKFGREQQLGGYSCDLREGLDLVALGTVADIVPLLGENRCLVKYGVRVLSAQRRPGIRALCEVSGIRENVRAQDIAFRLAPRLNAAGRVGEPADSLKLLQTASIVDAYRYAKRLDECNRRRQDFEQGVLEQAMAQVQEFGMEDHFGLAVAGAGWHQGVIGIVASRLAREFHRPCIVLTIDKSGEVHGSGRSVDGIDLVEALGACNGSLIRFGGHPMAVGLTLSSSGLDEFRARFDAVIRHQLDGVRPVPELNCDGEVRLAELDDRFFDELEHLRPFGHAYRPPVFRFQGVAPARIRAIGSRHSKGIVYDRHGGQMQFVAFGKAPDELPRGEWDLVATPEMNVRSSGSYPQIQLVDVRPSGHRDATGGAVRAARDSGR